MPDAFASLEHWHGTSTHTPKRDSSLPPSSHIVMPSPRLVCSAAIYRCGYPFVVHHVQALTVAIKCAESFVLI